MKLLRRLLLAVLLLVAVVATAGWVLVTPERIAAALLQPGGVRSGGQQPRDLGLVSEDFAVTTADGVQLAGWFLPAAAATARSVLVLHGVGAGKAGGLGLAGALHQAGVGNVALFDFRGHGQSGGEQFTYGGRERADVAAVVAWLRQRVPGLRLSLVAWSAGAAIALVAAAGMPDLEHVVAINAFADLPAMAARRRPWFVPVARYQRALALAEASAGFLLADVRPVAVMAQIRARVLLIVGLADAVIPPSDSQALHAAAQGRAELWSLPGIGHDDWWRHPQFTARVAEFLAR